MSALVKHRRSKQPPPQYNNELQSLNILSRQLAIFQKNNGLAQCDQCGKKVQFKELERMNVYSDFLVCGKCKN